MIDKDFNPRFVTFKSRNYYILMNNIIDCSFTAEEARNVLKVKYPALDKLVDDAEWERMQWLYKLLDVAIGVRFVKRVREWIHFTKCEECNLPTVDEEDRLCHNCYHKSCDEGDCWCCNIPA